MQGQQATRHDASSCGVHQPAVLEAKEEVERAAGQGCKKRAGPAEGGRPRRPQAARHVQRVVGRVHVDRLLALVHVIVGFCGECGGVEGRRVESHARRHKHSKHRGAAS